MPTKYKRTGRPSGRPRKVPPPPTLFEDMKRAWQKEESASDGPGVKKLREMCKADFLGFMKLYREEEKRDADLASVKADLAAARGRVVELEKAVPAAGGVDEGEGRARELIGRLLKDAEGKPWESE